VKSTEAVAIINYFVPHDLDTNLKNVLAALQSWKESLRCSTLSSESMASGVNLASKMFSYNGRLSRGLTVMAGGSCVAEMRLVDATLVPAGRFLAR
jgi:hypothetical protein